MYINIMHNILYGNDVHIKLNWEKYFFYFKMLNLKNNVNGKGQLYLFSIIILYYIFKLNTVQLECTFKLRLEKR